MNFEQHVNEYLKTIESTAKYRDFDVSSIEDDGPSLVIYRLMSKQQCDACNVLVLPGTAVYGLFYAEFCLYLNEQGFNVYTLEYRGHGQSEWERGNYSLDELVGGTQRLIDRVQAEQKGPLYLLAPVRAGYCPILYRCGR